MPSSRDHLNPGIKPRFPALQVDSLPAEPQGKPTNTGVGRPFPSLEDLPNPGIKPRSPALQADSLPSELPGNVLIQQTHRSVEQKEPRNKSTHL